MKIISLVTIFCILILPYSCISQQVQIPFANNTHTNDFSPFRLHNKQQWNGQWIWLNKDLFPNCQRTFTEWIHPKGTEQKRYRALFRKSFDLATLPGSPTLFITGDVRFQVYVNDSLAGEGPVNIGSDYADSVSPAYWYYSAFSISKWLKKGKNTIAVVVFSWGLEISETTSSFGRLLCELENDGKPLLASDGSWKAVADSSYSYGAGFLQFDATKEIANWTAGNFDDNNWPQASMLQKPSSNKLFSDKIPSPMIYTVAPLATESGKELFTDLKTSQTYQLDFGKNIPAHIQFSVDAHAGDTIDILPYEKSRQSVNRALRYICAEGANSYRTPMFAAFRYLEVKIRSPRGLHIKKLQALFSSYPVQYKGAFSCSDSFYTSLWNTARYTTQICMGNMFYDSPLHQEPIGCTGDYFIESMNNYYAFGDPWLTRQNLVQTAQMMEKNDYRMFHTSYSLLWVQMLRQYVLHTGDTGLLRQLLPHADRLMHRFIGYLDADHLVSKAPNYMFMDWVSINGFNAHHPPAVIGMGYLSALLYKAMNDIDAMRALQQASAAAPNYKEAAAAIKEGINRLLWDSTRQLYRDGISFRSTEPANDWLPADSALSSWSAHINTMAVLYDIAPENQQRRLLDYVIKQQQYELQPYFMSYVLGAIKKLSMNEEGLQLIERWRNGMDPTTKTLKENWRDQTDFGYGGDYSHAWGGAPLLFLSQQVLGVTPGNSGYDTIYIHPYTGNKIQWANGKVPVGTSAIMNVDWKKTSKGFSFEYNIPSGKVAVFFVPVLLRQWRLVVNNKELSDKVSSLLLQSGKHRLLVLPLTAKRYNHESIDHRRNRGNRERPGECFVAGSILY